MKSYTDFLVIGSGIAGLTYAIKVAEAQPHKKVLVVTKSNGLESNTRYAQGGIAAVLYPEKSDYQSHYIDTIKAGDYLNDFSIVDLTVRSAYKRIAEIISWGASFDKDENGQYHLCLEGGHSNKRILHHKDVTGLEIQNTLLNLIKAYPNITVLTHSFAKDLIVNHKSMIECNGAQFINIDSGEEYEVISGKVILSTGGMGQVYKNTTNPLIATGDGIAMAYRAGVVIDHMEFIQFHPTALFSPDENPSFLISEAVRGVGGILVNKKGNAFMQKYSYLESLAPRDIVARAIELEMRKENEDHVYLDCSKISAGSFKDHFPNIYNKCQSIGIDPEKEFIPVTPAAHYVCGGIKTDKWGQTSIKNLYAIGECAFTGLHGANRLASNSLLEALVFAHQAFVHSTSNLKECLTLPELFVPTGNSQSGHQRDIMADKVKEKINLIMTEHAGIIRNYNSIQEGLNKIKDVLEEIKSLSYCCEKMEVLNIATVSNLILSASFKRKENRGLYFNTDLINDQKVKDAFSVDFK